MNRQELEHVIRAAGEIVGGDVVVIGSQAILGAFPAAPGALLRSMEADLYPIDDPDRAIEIDGAIGDGSYFHDTYGYYAHGVGVETAVLPSGWEDRLVAVEAPSAIAGRPTRSGWCLDPLDLLCAKLAAGREHDWEFVETALRAGLVDPSVLRLRGTDMPDSHRAHVVVAIEGVIARAT